MSNPVHFDDTGSVAYLPAHFAVVNLNGLPGVATPPKGPAGAGTALPLGAQPTEPVTRKILTPGDEHLVYWGDDNAFPQQLIAQVSKSTVIPQGLADKAALWIGGGLFATIDEETQTPIDDPEIKAFLTDITMERFLLESSLDFAWFSNGFPEFILSKNREKIVQLHANETAYCRWGRMNERTGEMDKVYLNANWPQASATDAETVTLPAINPYAWDRIARVRKAKDFKFVYPLSFPSPGKTYYQLANWDSARSSGWLKVLEAIPQFKMYEMENQMSIKYHIEVPYDYWKRVYGERWETADFAGKMAIRDEFLKGLMDKLTNVQNAGKGILTDKWYEAEQDEWMGITINVLDDKTKDGRYIGDYSEGIANLLYAVGLDPSLFGYAGGDKLGGGSDKREAFWIFLSKSKPYRDRIIEPVKFAAEYNGWKKRYPDLAFKFRDTLLTTLDTGKSTTKVNTPAS